MKLTQGSIDLPQMITDADEIDLCGLCTDICVISNAMILKATFPEVKITVESHNTALDAMKTVASTTNTKGGFKI